MTASNQLGKVVSSVSGVSTAEFTAAAALAGMEQLLEAQRANWMITYRTYTSRVHIRLGANPQTGLVENPTYSFFSTPQGQSGSGFDRVLDPADVSLNSAGILPANLVFVASELMFRFGSGMPYATQVAIAERGFASSVRGNVTTNFGRPLDYPCPLGVFVVAASTTLSQTTIAPWGNGPQNAPTQMPKDGRVYFPAKQQILYQLKVAGSFYATTDGLPLSGTQSNSLIPNKGEAGESQGYIELILRGYEIVQPG